MTPAFSILIPCIPERMNMAAQLYRKLHQQIADAKANVEVLCLIDDCRMSVGTKRQKLLDIARGDYIAFVDDDDDVTDRYVPAIWDAILESRCPACRGTGTYEDPQHGHEMICGCRGMPDVFTFVQQIYLNGIYGEIEFRAGHPENESPSLDTEQEHPRYRRAVRPPWHVCVWRASIARRAKFPAQMSGEDWLWAAELQRHIATSHHIDEALHVYRYDGSVTRASLDEQQRGDV